MTFQLMRQRDVRTYTALTHRLTHEHVGTLVVPIIILDRNLSFIIILDRLVQPRRSCATEHRRSADSALVGNYW